MEGNDALNQQIADAVAAVNRILSQASGSTAGTTGKQQVTLGLGLAVFDAVAQLESLYSVQTALTAKALALLLADEAHLPQAEQAMAMAQHAVQGAVANLEQLSRTASAFAAEAEAAMPSETPAPRPAEPQAAPQPAAKKPPAKKAPQRRSTRRGSAGK